MRTIKLYLDDARETPEGWVRVYTVEQCIALLETGIVEYVSFDNDLGDGQPEGHIALDHLEMLAFTDPTFLIPKITVHSANEGRAPSMRQVAEKLETMRMQQMERASLGYCDLL
jgi:hypothetical protein